MRLEESATIMEKYFTCLNLYAPANDIL